MRMAGRIEALERKVAPSGLQFLHMVGKAIGQTKAEALEEYGLGKIAESDGIVWIRGFDDPDFQAEEANGHGQAGSDHGDPKTGRAALEKGSKQ